MAEILTRQQLAHLNEPTRQIVYALERARDANQDQADRLMNALDYNAEFFAEDAESLQKAIDWILAAGRAHSPVRRGELAQGLPPPSQHVPTLAQRLLKADARLLGKPDGRVSVALVECSHHAATFTWRYPK
ncbi:hypothetical protein SOM08_06125 [Hydrogenophaga sp. SNF1]|uniref:hypothetical protein n=1 Tax=Hydrogenophaga sp. SNF1 TaxID=3098762 RepID=UPI002ACC22E6|nr:hypothetical protein [Hydrogenophaga sp. SNF1]WQB84888.1 hypothetical protein SOM08_06125 [Hydrogenophaga sp. SNF1]